MVLCSSLLLLLKIIQMNKFLNITRRKPLLFRLMKCVLRGITQGTKTAKWLLKITIPISLAVLLLDYFGIIAYIADFTSPVFKYFGLPGVAAIILFTSIFTNIYSVILIIATLALPMREGTIIATMCLISHAFPIETAVLSKTGSSAVRMLIIRFVASFVAAYFMNLLMPGKITNIVVNTDIVKPEFWIVIKDWALSMLNTVVKILILVNLLNILQKILDEFKVTVWLTRPLKPFMKLFGLPESATLGWIVANTLGLSYGSAVMISLVEDKKLNKKDADLLNHHNAVSHSQLEDPLLFMTFGYSIAWLIFPRVILAIVCVWLRKLELYIRHLGKK
jgi:hypothetical protein